MSNKPPPFAQVLQLILGKWVSGTVCALAKLGVPDHVDDTPRSAEEIAAAVGAKADLLYRLMRAAAGLGVLSETVDGKFVQTPLSAALRSDSVPCVRNMAMFNSDEWHVRGWGLLDHTVRTGERPVEKIWGVPVFEYLTANQAAGLNFHRGMTDMSTVEGPPVADAYDFTGIETITDVAGGYGLLLALILQKHPGMRGTLYDQAAVIEGASGGPTAPVKDRVTYVAGDMFASVPKGSDAYIMKHIIHDWPDGLCVKLLQHCRAAVNPGGKLLVVEPVVPGPNEFHVGKIMDLEMMLFPSGKERTEVEFRELFAAAGWKFTRVIPTASHVSIVEGIAA